SALNIRFENPRPFSRLQLSDAGIEVVVRYPVPLQTTAQAGDEISRRLIDAINREPGLRLGPQSTPSLQRADASSSEEPAPATTVAVSTSPAANAPPAPAAQNDSGITPVAAAAAGAAGVAAANAVASAPDVVP